MVVMAGGCAGVLRVLNDGPPPAAESRDGKAAQQHHAEALAADDPATPVASVEAAEYAAKQCLGDINTLTSVSRGDGAHSPLYDADAETIPTVRGPRTLNAVKQECHDLEVALHARLASTVARAVPEFTTTAGELEQYIAEQTNGYHATTQLHGTLDAVTSWDVPVGRGTCYVLVWRVDAGGALGETARSGVEALVEIPGRSPSDANALHGPGGVILLFCPYQPGTAHVLLGVHGGRPSEVGHGGFTMQVYEKTITEPEVAALERETARSEAFHQQRIRDVCMSCERRRDRCLDAAGSGPTQCSRDYEVCFQTASVRREDCH